MGIEIERKFLVANDAWRAQVKSSTVMRQGYLSTGNGRSVRVRLAGERAVLTIKKRVGDATRLEFEYDIPADDAVVLLDQVCQRPLVEKTRHVLEFDGMTWEVDVFEGENEGLVLAEVELENETSSLSVPAWAGEEVTNDSRYYNANLVTSPFKDWSGTAPT